MQQSHRWTGDSPAARKFPKKMVWRYSPPIPSIYPPQLLCRLALVLVLYLLLALVQYLKLALVLVLAQLLALVLMMNLYLALAL